MYVCVIYKRDFVYIVHSLTVCNVNFELNILGTKTNLHEEQIYVFCAVVLFPTDVL